MRDHGSWLRDEEAWRSGSREHESRERRRLGAAAAEKLTGIWNMSKYIYVVRTQIIRSLTYEFNVYGNIIMQTIIMITSAYFWRALYRNKEIVGGVDAESMLTYIIVSSVLSVLLITNVERRIEMSVQKGTIATDMMKPVNIFGVYFAEDAGNIAALVFQNMLPILLIGSLLIKECAYCHTVEQVKFGVGTAHKVSITSRY